jgi:tRNA U34 5-carboxymethylaminomethyl modifying GTPase MnmE/TrmE
MEVDIVTAAEHLRYAADALASITGKGESGDVEDVLGVVFEKYAPPPLLATWPL